MLVCFYGEDKIDFNMEDLKKFKNAIYKPFKGIDVVGFSLLNNFSRILYPGGSVLAVVPKTLPQRIRKRSKTKNLKKDDSEDYLAFYSLLNRLNERKMGIVVQYTLRAFQPTLLGLMVPHFFNNCENITENNFDGFLLLPLAFFNDIKCNNLSIDMETNFNTLQNKYEDEILEQLSLFLETNFVDINEIQNTLNSKFQKYCNVI